MYIYIYIYILYSIYIYIYIYILFYKYLINILRYMICVLQYVFDMTSISKEISYDFYYMIHVTVNALRINILLIFNDVYHSIDIVQYVS